MVSLFYWQQLLPAISEILLTPSSALLLSDTFSAREVMFLIAIACQ